MKLPALLAAIFLPTLALTAEAPPQLPPTIMHVCFAHCGTWYLTTDGKGYAAAPGLASVPVGTYGITIRSFTNEQVIIDRYDPPNQWFAQGLKAVINGQVSAAGNSLANGKINWVFGQSGIYGAWMTWGSALNGIPGQGDPPPGGFAAKGAPASPPPASPPPATSADGPDRSQAEDAINRRFIAWSSGWAFDRYQRGSDHITNMNCGPQGCGARGQFSFFRGAGMLTIEFAADFNKVGADNYQLGRLCYNDASTGMRACAN